MARATEDHAYLALAGARRAPRQTRLRDEYTRADRVLRQFDEVRELAQQARSHGDEELGSKLDHHAWSIVREAEPVRLSYAAAVLGIVDQTVRDWVAAGLLEDFGGAPQRVGLDSVARVRELVRDLRADGNQRDLMTAVLRALELDELRSDDRFQASLNHMRRGERAE
jgi:hypothetical protein